MAGKSFKNDQDFVKNLQKKRLEIFQPFMHNSTTQENTQGELIMKKKIILLAAMTAMAAFLTVGCSTGSKTPETTSPETSVETTVETTEAVTEDTSAAAEDSQPDAAAQEPIVTPGVFKSEETIAENERQATFVDENGIEFIANISELTEVKGELKEGETYLISHSEVMTMSLPGIYPQVYTIEPADTKLEVQEVESESSSAAN